MFDKLYKEANDEIPVNTKLMEQLKSEASKERRKNPYSFMYKYGFAAAAVLIITVSLNVLPQMNKNSEEDTQYLSEASDVITENIAVENHETSESSTKEKSSGVIIPEEKLNTYNADKDKQKKENHMADNSSENNSKVSESSFSEETAADDIQADTSANQATESESSRKQTYETRNAAERIEENDGMAKNFVSVQEDMADTADKANEYSDSGRAAGGASQAPAVAFYSTKAVDAQKWITFDEYCRYYGFNPQNWNIPSDMDRITGDGVFVDVNSETGEYDAAMHTVTYSGQGKKLSVTLFPNGDDVLSLINSQNGEKYKENCLMVENTASSYTVYIVKNGKGYIVETENLEKVNVYSLIDSIG